MIINNDNLNWEWVKCLTPNEVKKVDENEYINM